MVADWFFEKDNNCIIIEDKESTDKNFESAEKQLKLYCDAVKNLCEYKHIIGIVVKENTTGTHKVRVFVDGELQKDHPIDGLNKLDYYFALCNSEFDKQSLIQNINDLNEWLHSNNINDNIRATLCCTLLVAIDKGLEIYNSDTINSIKSKVKDKLAEYQENDLNKWNKIKFLYNRFCRDIDTKISTLNVGKIVEIFSFIKNKIWLFLKQDNKNQSYDIMSIFFTTFGKKALTNDLGQFFTPDHFSDLMTELLELNVNSKVIDIACGSGTFLAKCLDKMIAKANNDEEKIKDIKKNQIYGIEIDPNVYGLAMANMIMHKDGKSNVYNANSFDEQNQDIKNLSNLGIDRLILNPPYSNEYYKELEFLKKGLDILNTNGIGVIILPTSCATGNEQRLLREELMSKHTLKAVFSAPRQLFYPAGTNTCIMVWEAHKPHEGYTYLMDWKDDTFVKKNKKKYMYCPNFNKWIEVRKKWLSDYFGEKKLGILKKLAPEDSWLYESYLEIDYDKEISSSDFNNSIKQYASFNIANQLTSDTNKKINFTNWKEFKLKSLFDFARGEDESPNASEKFVIDNAIKCVTAKNNNCGIGGWKLSPIKVWKRDALAFVGQGDGGAGLCYYVDAPFCANKCIWILLPKEGIKFNKYIGLFLSSILSKNKKRFFHGYPITIKRLEDMTIKLPISSDGNPDWQWIEDYIKSLSCGKYIL